MSARYGPNCRRHMAPTSRDRRTTRARVDAITAQSPPPGWANSASYLATAHDLLGEYQEALAAYETFLARADASKNQLEIEKVNLRLPSLRNQIKRGEGAKKKKKASEE